MATAAAAAGVLVAGGGGAAGHWKEGSAGGAEGRRTSAAGRAVDATALRESKAAAAGAACTVHTLPLVGMQMQQPCHASAGWHADVASHQASVLKKACLGFWATSVAGVQFDQGYEN